MSRSSNRNRIPNIREYFADRKLPTDEILLKDHKFYGCKEQSNVVIFKYGYFLDKETGNYEGRRRVSNNETPVAIINPFIEIVKYSTIEELLKVSVGILKEAEDMKKRTSAIHKEETLEALAEVEAQYQK